jgi:hypothetical protein
MAASRARPAPVAKTMARPWWNGAEIRPGKNSRPVRVCRAGAGSAASAPLSASRCRTGFTPSSAANSEDTGGRAPM